ncbi:MAG: hypothetical protein LUH63_05615 [Parabacteroides sp.]|nr:hypothetical protein [Parabacteroides sp.]
MEYSSDIRTRVVAKQAGTNASVGYEVLNPTGQPVTVINGTISKENIRIGRLNVDVASDTAYISFEQFSKLTHAERKEALAAISDHFESILTEPAE